jgi:hypothetical protein
MEVFQQQSDDREFWSVVSKSDRVLSPSTAVPGDSITRSSQPRSHSTQQGVAYRDYNRRTQYPASDENRFIQSAPQAIVQTHSVSTSGTINKDQHAHQSQKPAQLSKANGRQDSRGTLHSAARALVTAFDSERAVDTDELQGADHAQSAGTYIASQTQNEAASETGEFQANPTPRVDNEANYPHAILQGPEVSQQVLEAQTQRFTTATPATAHVAVQASSRSIDASSTAMSENRDNSTSDAMNTDQDVQDSHLGQEPARASEANRRHGARVFTSDAVASVLEAAGDAEPVEDMIVVPDRTQAQSAVIHDASSAHREMPSEIGKSQADPLSEVDTTANQPHLVLQGYGSPEAETHQATVPSQLNGNASHESGLRSLVSKLGSATSSTDKHTNCLRSVFFRLYLEEGADPLEPQCCVKLSGLTTRDELFAMMHEDLQDDLDAGDQIVVVKVKRADGEVFRGPNVRTMPIKKVGQQDMWEELINTLVKHGAGEEGLMGYVKVKKSVHAK